MSAPQIADRLARRIRWEELDPATLRRLISIARAEDLEGWGLAARPGQTGDVTSQILQAGPQQAEARLVAREDMVVCGLPLVPMVLQAYGEDTSFRPACGDGEACPRETLLGTLQGPARTLLEAERVLLNFLQKLSGVASLTRRFVEAMADSPTRLLDTRKTTPGFRLLEKYAVACGGGFNHRIGLFDRVMLKDNHLAAEDSTRGEALARLVQTARSRWPGLVIELEVDHPGQIPPALDAGVDVFLLDNFSREDLSAALGLIGNRAATEASGGITLANLDQFTQIGLDFISTGATIHQSVWKDIGLDWS